jgi:hypothetical protein
MESMNMRLAMIGWVLGLGLYYILEMLLRDAVPAIARASDTWQSLAFPILLSVVAAAFCELMTMRSRR